jgi:RNA polymerase sigma factor (sigma-70 family)
VTSEEFGAAYQRHFSVTVRFLMARGIGADAAQETAQAAWTRGWERLSQLRDPRTLVMWLNRVALNIYRSFLRREPPLRELTRSEEGPGVNVAAIDAASILERCKTRDRRMLRDFYLNGMNLSEIAARNGWRENTARVRLFRARQAARISLQHREAKSEHRPVTH